MILYVGFLSGLLGFAISAAIWGGLGLMGFVAVPTDEGLAGLLLLCSGGGTVAPVILIGIVEFFDWLWERSRR